MRLTPGSCVIGALYWGSSLRADLIPNGMIMMGLIVLSYSIYFMVLMLYSLTFFNIDAVDK
jgi:hypothetical protein